MVSAPLKQDLDLITVNIYAIFILIKVVKQLDNTGILTYNNSFGATGKKELTT